LLTAFIKFLSQVNTYGDMPKQLFGPLNNIGLTMDRNALYLNMVILM